MEEEPCSLASIAKSQRLPVKEFEKQYKNHLSNFRQWDQKEHAEEWLLFADNIGPKLSIDETALSKGELYTIITNKQAHCRKGSIVAIAEGIKATNISKILGKIPLCLRKTVKEVTLDMSNSMNAIVRTSFPEATIVTDRFHVQQLVSEAVQDLRVSLKREAMKEENEIIKKIQENNKNNKQNNNEKKEFYKPEVYENGDTKKQLLARSRYLLFKPKNQWYD